MLNIKTNDWNTENDWFLQKMSFVYSIRCESVIRFL